MPCRCRPSLTVTYRRADHNLEGIVKPNSIQSFCTTSPRPIDRRYMPRVAGHDLIEALNYIQLEHVGRHFIYSHYTAARLAYVAGNRPVLDAVAAEVIGGMTDELEIMAALADFVAHKVRWAGFYQKDTGQRLATTRGFTEEQLIDSGYAWCNAQGRVLCALTQVLGFSSRLVFIGGHVIVEVLLRAGWLTVDQSFGYCFVRDGQPIAAVDIYYDPANRDFFQPIYNELCRDLIADLGVDLLSQDFVMSIGENPFDGFKQLGFYNHFII
jgi:transglutaminase-like putative cysteine protease